MLPWSRRRLPAPRVIEGERLYAIGDIHGEASLFQRLLTLIAQDDRLRPPVTTRLIVLGDFIDRGSQAANLLNSLMGVCGPRMIVLRGNHEELLIRAYRGEPDALDLWLRVGGRATLASFGIDDELIDQSDDAALVAAMHRAIDPALIRWLEYLPTSWSNGDYFFAHAGIMPDTPLDQQDDHALLWGSREFLSSRRDHGKVVVHGHYTVTGAPRLGGNRIGVDTGAHEHRLITALGLEDDRQWLLQAND